MLRFFSATILTSLLCFTNVYAQIQLKLVDPDSVVIPYANTQLIPSTGEDIFLGAASDTNGLVLYHNINTGSYFMVVRYLGFNTDTIANIVVNARNEAIDLGYLIMQPTSLMLEEFGVKGQRPTVIYESNGDFSFNPESTTMGSNEDATKLLETIPGVSYNSAKGYQINGNPNIKILIDGRDLGGDKSTVENYLESIPSENIQEIKVIKSATTKYDASASGGVINIILKKSSYAGINGFIYNRYRQGQLGSYKGRFNLNWKVKKFSGSVFYEYHTFQGFHDAEVTRTVALAIDHKLHYNELLYESWKQITHLPRMAFNYDINSNNRIGLMVEFQRQTTTQPINGQIFPSEDNADPDSIIHNSSFIKDADLWPAVNFNYGVDVKGNGNKLDFTYDFFYKIDNRANDFVYEVYNPGMTQLLNIIEFSRDNDYKQPVHTASIDFSKGFNRDIKIDIGTKVTVIEKKSDSVYKLKVGDEEVIQPNLSRSFDYMEKTFAGYANWSKQFNGWNLTLGLRIENTIIDQQYLSESTSLETKYLDFFPSINMYKQLNDKVDFRVGYTRGLTRPSFLELNPVRVELGPFLAASGNPNLRPQIDNLVGMEFTFNNRYSLYFNYNATNYSVNSIFKEEENGVFNITYANFDRSHFFVAGGNASTKINEWWMLNTEVNFYFDKYNIEIDEEEVSTNGAAVAFAVNSQFILPKNFFIDLNGNFESSRFYAIERFKRNGSMDASITKNMFDDRFTIKLQVLDIFRTKQLDIEQNYLDLNSTYFETGDSRRFELLINYRFRRGENFRGKQNKRSNQEELIRS